MSSEYIVIYGQHCYILPALEKLDLEHVHINRCGSEGRVRVFVRTGVGTTSYPLTHHWTLAIRVLL